MTDEKSTGMTATGSDGLHFATSRGPIHPGIRFLMSLVACLIAYFAAAFFASALGSSRRAVDVIFRSLFLMFLLAIFSFLLKTADEEDGNPLSAMGLSLRTPWVRDASCGLLIGFSLIAIAYTVIRFTCESTTSITFSGKTAKLLCIELVVLSAGAMAEEVVFRGYPFQRLLDVVNEGVSWLTRVQVVTCQERASKAGPYVAAVVWSGAFGAVHIGNPNVSVFALVNTAFVGILFCIAYFRTRSLWMPWGIHFAWNATLGMVFGLPVSGLNDFSVVVKSKVNGPVWITGGNYGIEGSALGTAAIVVGIVLVCVFVKQRGAFSDVPQAEVAAVFGADQMDNSIQA